MDGGATQTYRLGVHVTGGAEHTVTYWSTDKAGNVETANTLRVNIDTTAPGVTATAAPASWTNGTVTVTITTTDAGAGPDKGGFAATAGGGATATLGTAAKNADGSWSVPVTVTGPAGSQGSYTVTCTGADLAGNTATATATAKIDHQAPGVPTISGGDALWHNKDVTLSASGSSDGSGGSGGVQYQYSLDGQTWTTITTSPASYTVGAPSSHANDGSHTVYFRALDAAGNAGPSAKQTVNIDTTAPGVTATAAPASWTNGTVTVTITTTDAGAGPDKGGFAATAAAAPRPRWARPQRTPTAAGACPSQ